MSEHGQKEDEDGQLKTDAEAENDGKKEAGVLLDGDHGVELGAEAKDQNLQRAGEDKEVTEAGAGRNKPTVAAMKGMTKRLSFW